MSENFDQERVLEKPCSIEEHYDRLKLLVESIKEDAVKAQKGNKSAGIRLRKSLRLVKEYSGNFVKFTLGKD